MFTKKHEIKLKEQYVENVLNGNKTFELRYNDRDYQRGDYIKFKVVDRLGKPVFDITTGGKLAKYVELEAKEYEITYVLGAFDGLVDGWVILGIKEVING